MSVKSNFRGGKILGAATNARFVFTSKFAGLPANIAEEKVFSRFSTKSPWEVDLVFSFIKCDD